MKQVLQSVRDGEVVVTDVPAPVLRPAGILVRTATSLVSPGTDRALTEFAAKGLFGKARSRPDLVAKVVDKARRDGVTEALRVAFARLDQQLAPGYATAGTVIAVGAEVDNFKVGDAVACGGAGYACHAEINYVPRNLAVSIPTKPSGELLPFDEAVFATLGAVALHASRLAQPGAGDRAVVIGLGLVGLLAGQILQAHGCVVVGVDPNESRCALARALGFEEAVAGEAASVAVAHATEGLGADLVLVTASAEDSAPVTLAGEVARDRARVVSVGATGLDLDRRLFYRKELSLVVSRSYGPGRYDPAFEEAGHEYPAAYVRWTERGNMRAFLELVARGRVRVSPLVTDRMPVDDAGRGYELLVAGTSLGILFTYDCEAPIRHSAGRVELPVPGPRAEPAGTVGISLIGAGTFAREMLLPGLRGVSDIELRGVVTANGVSARSVGERFGFRYCAESTEAIWNDERTRAVVIATRNDLHAGLVTAALAAGKAVFVEKPLCITAEELAWIRKAHAAGSLLMVGFNRRFAPMVAAIKRELSAQAPIAIGYRVNAGPLSADSWVANAAESGGRIISEVCHFIDLAAFLAGAAPRTVFAQSVGSSGEDVVAIVSFDNGSTATIGYYATGHRAFSKERIEVFGRGMVGVIDDFRSGILLRDGRRRRLGRWLGRPDKGHRQEIAAFVAAVRTGAPSPVPFEEAVSSTAATFALRDSLRAGVAVVVSD